MSKERSDAAKRPLDRRVGGWRKLLWLAFGSHKWEYHRTPSGKINPYSRICSVCGRHEESVCQSLESWNRSWWEVWNDGDEQKHYQTPNVRANLTKGAANEA